MNARACKQAFAFAGAFVLNSDNASGVAWSAPLSPARSGTVGGCMLYDTFNLFIKRIRTSLRAPGVYTVMYLC